MTQLPPSSRIGRGYGAGKVILLGEHAVVYGRPALAAGLPDGMHASVRLDPEAPGRISCRGWNLDLPLNSAERLAVAINRVLESVGVDPSRCDIELTPQLPAAAGLGSSAALCVAVARAGAAALGHDISVEQAAEAAFEGELCFHGTPSGIDNTVAAFGGVLWFRKPAERRLVHLGHPLPLVIAHSGSAGETAKQVALVRAAHDAERVRYEAIFDQVEALVHEAHDFLVTGDHEAFGGVMNQNHELLQAMGVSTPALDELVQIARSAGAVGAKLTGAGGGGCILALCPDRPENVASAIEAAGYRTFLRTIQPRS